MKYQFFKGQNKIIIKETENYYHLKLKIHEENCEMLKFNENILDIYSHAQTVFYTVHLICSTRTVLWLLFFFFFFSAGFICAFCFLSFLLNIYYLNVHIQLHWLNKFLQYFHNYLTISTIHGPLFFFSFFFFLFSTVCRFCLCYICFFF